MTEIETLRLEIERRLITVAPSRQFVISFMSDVDKLILLNRQDAFELGSLYLADQCF